MKLRLSSSLLVAALSAVSPVLAGAADTGWMRPGVRVWYLGAVGQYPSSNAEEAYLLDTVFGGTVSVVHHKATEQWKSPQPVVAGNYPLLDIGACWIHPARLQTLKQGERWRDQIINLVVPTTVADLQFQFLPVKALAALNPQRVIIKVTYMIPYFSIGTAYFDADTGLMLYYDGVWEGSRKMFFALAEINYDFARHVVLPETNGPHTGFMSTVSEQSGGTPPFPYGTGGGSVIIQSQVESRYGATVEMRVKTTITAPPYPRGNGQLTMADENYCFFGDVPSLRRLDATQAPNYPPEQWNLFGQYLPWWLPQAALRTQAANALVVPADAASQAINVYDVVMARTADALPTFTATQQPSRFFFSTLWLDKDGYLIKFSARDPTTGLNLQPTDDIFQNLTSVDGRDYYASQMALRPVSTTPDFDGDGRSDLVWQNRVTGQITFWMMDGLATRVQVPIAGPSDRRWRIVAVADFDKDGNADLVMRHAATGENQVWYMDKAAHTRTGALPPVADARWQIVAAVDFNGDRQADLLWRNAATGDVVVWYLNAGAYAGFELVASISDPTWVMAGVADFNADGQPDIIWHNASTGENLLWYMNGAVYAGWALLPTEADTNWTIVGVTDYTGDGQPDLLWRNAATGANRIWRMSDATLLGADTLPAMTDVEAVAIGAEAGRTRAALSDFNADGKPDILWHNSATGESRVWYMAGSTGATRLADVSLGTENDVTWKTVAVADFNRDGLPDIVWRNSTTGANRIWLMAGRTHTGDMTLPTIPDGNWKIVGVGDFNQDGHPDLAWRNYATGDNIIWFLINGEYAGWTAPPTIRDTDWKIVAIGDFNGDGWPDLLWRNQGAGPDAGKNIAWFLVAGVYAGWAAPPAIGDPTWHIVGAADYNADGKADLLWRNAATGENLLWYLIDGQYAGWAALPTLDVAWKTGAGQ